MYNKSFLNKNGDVMLTEFNLNKNEDIYKQISEVNQFFVNSDNCCINIETVKDILHVFENQQQRARTGKRFIQIELCYQRSQNYNFNEITSLFQKFKTEKFPKYLFESLVNSSPASLELILNSSRRIEDSWVTVDNYISQLQYIIKDRSEQIPGLANKCIQILVTHPKLQSLISNLVVKLVEDSKSLKDSHILIEILCKGNADLIFTNTTSSSFKSHSSSNLLHIGSDIGSLPMVRTLIKLGANPFELDGRSRTSYQITQVSQQIEKAKLLRSTIRTHDAVFKLFSRYIPEELIDYVLQFVFKKPQYGRFPIDYQAQPPKLELTDKENNVLGKRKRED